MTLKEQGEAIVASYQAVMANAVASGCIVDLNIWVNVVRPNNPELWDAAYYIRLGDYYANKARYLELCQKYQVEPLALVPDLE